MNCPVCGGKAVGKVGVSQYYCWNCFLEYQVDDGKVKIFSVAEDGSLVDFESTVIT